MFFPTEEVADGFRELVILQFEAVWTAANSERGISSGPEVRAGTSHPDFGKKWGALPRPVQDFIMFLHILRLSHFKDLHKDGDLLRLVRIGRGEEELPEDLLEKVAKRFHNDWWIARRVLYQFKTEEERQTLIAFGLKPFPEHEGDKPWEEETPAQQGNDRGMVYKWAKLLAQCERDTGNIGRLFQFLISAS